MFGGALFLMPFGLWEAITSPPGDVTPAVLVGVLYSGALAAAIANVIVFNAIRLAGPTRVMSLMLLVPAGAVALGAVALGRARPARPGARGCRDRGRRVAPSPAGHHPVARPSAAILGTMTGSMTRDLPDPAPGIGVRSLPVPPLRPGQLPVAFLVDYDGTIARTDVSDALMAEFATAEWDAHIADRDAGRVGSRRLMAWEIGLVDAEPEALLAKAAAQPHDETFRSFAERALGAGIRVEIVSDGFGFFIEPALRTLGVGQLPVVTAETTFGPDGAQIAFPNGSEDCYVCGTCKRNRVLAHQAAGRAVVFIGDGESDRYAAGYSDVVFAKHALVRLCVENGWPFERWTESRRSTAGLSGS